MKEFRFVNYYTEFSCSGDIELKMASCACFARAFMYLQEGNKSVCYIIKVYKGDTLKQKGLSNMCFFSERQIKNHLNQLKDLFPLKFKVYDSCNEKEPHFIIELDLKDVPGMYHRYALTWTRYLYEFPYNMILMDAYKLKEDLYFRFESTANLFNLIASCSDFGVGGGHGVTCGSRVGFLMRRELVAQLNQVDRLNSIYPVDRKVSKKYPNSVGKFDFTDIEYWQDVRLFEQVRKPIYVEEYKKRISEIIKKNKKKK